MSNVVRAEVEYENTPTSEEKEWRLRVHKLFHEYRPNVAKHFDFNRIAPLYAHGYGVGAAVLECMKMTNCIIFPVDVDDLIDE